MLTFFKPDFVFFELLIATFVDVDFQTANVDGEHGTLGFDGRFNQFQTDLQIVEGAENIFFAQQLQRGAGLLGLENNRL